MLKNTSNMPLKMFSRLTWTKQRYLYHACVLSGFALHFTWSSHFSKISQKTDSLGEFSLSVFLSHMLSLSLTPTHTKCWVSICEHCISWPVLSWQADQTKCPICSLMAQVRWMRFSVVSFCFLVFPSFRTSFFLTTHWCTLSLFSLDQFNSHQLVVSFSPSPSHYRRMCTSCH